MVMVQIDSRGSLEVKEKAGKELATCGFLESGEIPNAETMASLNEAIADLNTPHLKVACSFDELKVLLNG